MATQLFANNATSLLASSITDVATSLTVTTGHGARFPTITGSDYFLATLCQLSGVDEVNFEIVKVTARSTDAFTIVRAQEGTTGLAYNAGDKVELRITKGTMEGREATSNKDATGGYAGLTLFKLNLKNAANTFTNFFTNATTAARTWTMQDRDGTIADNTDLATKAAISAAQTFTGAQRGTVTALTSSAASIAINLATNNNFSHTTSENSTLAAPSNPVAGQSGLITITQGAAARTLAYNTFWKFAGGTVPTLTATISAVDIFAYYVESGTRATCRLIKDVK